MSNPFVMYEPMPHGVAAFPLAFYSENSHDVTSHYHREYELFYLAKGKMRFGVGGEEHVISAGTIVFVEPNVLHYALDMPEHGPRHFYSLLFDITALGQEADPCRIAMESIRINRFLTLPGDITSKTEIVTEMIARCDFATELYLKTYLYNILSYILNTKQYTQLSTLNASKPRSAAAVSDVISFIEEHYREKITAEDALAGVSYSKSHIMRLFREITGCSLISYINRYRVEKSCQELLYSSKSIRDIAIDNGFNNVQYFSKMFRTYMNATPGKYRAQARSYQLPLHNASPRKPTE